jgi:hypothetical protein
VTFSKNVVKHFSLCKTGFGARVLRRGQSFTIAVHVHIKGSKEEKKIVFLCCIKRRCFRCTKGPSKRIRSPRRRRRSYTMRWTWKSHLSLYRRRGEVLSCPKRYRSVESRHVFCTRRRKYSRRDCVRDVWPQCEKKKRFNAQIANIYNTLCTHLIHTCIDDCARAYIYTHVHV